VVVSGASFEIPKSTRVVVEFSNPDGSQFARMNVEATDLEYRFAENRYVVAEKRLDELFYTSQFSWKTVDTLKIYTSVIKNTTATHKEVSDGVATITTLTSHNFKVGDSVNISGAGSLNGIKTITEIPSPLSFSFEAEGTTIYQEIIPSGNVESGSSAFYVALDGLRIDNVSTINPLYGLVGYSIIQNEDRRPIIKAPNSTNFIEYRFIMDVT
jgi:hypothetical protein